MTIGIARKPPPAQGSIELRCRAYLIRIAMLAEPITYRALAAALTVRPPHSIHQVTDALEELMREDALAGRPFIAALVVSRVRDGLPAPSFFDMARRLGRFDGASLGEEAWAYYAREFADAVVHWGALAEARSDHTG